MNSPKIDVESFNKGYAQALDKLGLLMEEVKKEKECQKQIEDKL